MFQYYCKYVCIPWKNLSAIKKKKTMAVMASYIISYGAEALVLTSVLVWQDLIIFLQSPGDNRLANEVVTDMISGSSV